MQRRRGSQNSSCGHKKFPSTIHSPITRSNPYQPSHSWQGDQGDELGEVVQDSLRDLADDLEAVVRDQLKQELSGFRDSLDQFSLDIQWAAAAYATCANSSKNRWTLISAMTFHRVNRRRNATQVGHSGRGQNLRFRDAAIEWFAVV